jgi:beta-ureidopropionase / N-carbamoyl-L-amino-acid hydrolase
VFTREYADSRKDREGKSFGEELDRIGYRGTEKAGGHKLGAFFELHIEQGPILEDEGKTVGVVTGVQGMRWYEVTVTGFESHAGTTPMHLRRDAMVGCARMVDAINKVALDHAPLAVSTVGLVEVKPNSRNILPGQVFFTIDLRHPDDGVLGQMESEVRQTIDRIAADMKLEIQVEQVWDSPAVKFDPTCVEAVRTAAVERGYDHREIVSGAGHDAAYMARVAPTAMIFIPCEKGISHNEVESAEYDHVAAGANVLLRAVLEYDSRDSSGSKAG